MSPILDELGRRGVSVWRDGDELLFEAHSPGDSGALWDWLRAHHAEILAGLPSGDEGPRPSESAAVRFCSPHNNPANYLDGPAPGGMVRSTCKICGRFIGYRPRPARSRKSASRAGPGGAATAAPGRMANADRT
ncbi:MAG TPA: hypothetical protein VNH11_27590 [Pirellulales bacterium]|nr:hypothetical protein [Pirellulales bacterium]